MLKKIFKSKLFKLIFSIVLIYFAFKKVDVLKLFSEIKNVPIWFVLVNIFLSFLIVFLISLRWSLLLFSKITVKTILIFTKASFLAAFYSLFFSTAAAGDVLKWMVIDYKYPEIPKSKVLGSVILDRFIGFSLIIIFGLISSIFDKRIGLIIPNYVFYTLIVLAVVCIVIYIIIYFFDVSKLLPRITFLHKLDDAFELFKDKNRSQIAKGLLVSAITEMLWILQICFIGWKFSANLGILPVFIFIPIISIILVLPISVGGFGAREQLYLFFFLQVSNSSESILLMSAFLGILGVINSLFGGVLLFFDEGTRKKIKS